MTTQVQKNFSNYFENWMSQLEEFLRLLLMVPKETSYVKDHESLVNKMTTHHKDYYTVKWAAAHEDILSFFNPVWLSPLENAYLWVTGWKPSMAFRLVGANSELSDEQVKSIDALKVKIRAEEERVEREMERQQVALGDRKMVELARLNSSRVRTSGCSSDSDSNNQLDGLVEVALKGLMVSLERVMKMADCARLKTLKGLLDILNPKQCVDLLAAITMLQIQMRKWGRKKENLRS
ncbi:protein DOG1-like 4 [Nicotiana tabacum]|uniref:Protein DOG1-like 4 n=2 Tax=Nicotiana TaxID=4085 RepID=A0A1S4BMU5_TOBAC|nr:PREDICTED: transcription factor TGA6 [Nicotiana sylvestris]